MGGAETSAVMGTVHTCSEAQADHEHLKRNLDICYAYLHKGVYQSTTVLNIIPLLVENVGLIFTKGDLKEVSEEVLNIPTKINKGTIEIITPVELTSMPTRMYWQLPPRVETEYSFPQADKVKEYLADPSKFADSGAAPAEEKKEEPAEEFD
ncbi:hypothetical protein ACET3Z_009183 [Daucus carota]